MSVSNTGDLGHVSAPVIQRRDGITDAERYLKRLCDRTFLSLWSYPGIYRDQGNAQMGGEGKEVCDLLVVFQEHIIIFSDKDCAFPDSGNLQLDWSRWFRRAVQAAAEQIWGAERWIRTHPQRLFLDRACTQPFPLSLPALTIAKVHRIVVAHDASRRCQEILGGSGSLMIDPDVIGQMHYNVPPERIRPFVIGQIDPAKGYVHVFDDTSLDVILRTLDTITDFVSYLSKKERFILNGKLGMASGEEDILAWYLSDLDETGEHDFIIPKDADQVFITEGMWDDFIHSPQRQAQIEANRVSYAWDALIETFNTHILGGTQHSASHPDPAHPDGTMQFLAREPRTRRRYLARTLLEMIETTPVTFRRTRVTEPARPDDPYYVFLLLPRYASVPEAVYREVRVQVLEDCCLVTKLKYPGAQDIVGIATETGADNETRSEDACYFDARVWTAENQAEAESLQQDLGLLTNIQRFAGVEREYPIPEPPAEQSIRRMKGRNRNAPCPCGSGKKFKHCCGR